MAMRGWQRAAWVSSWIAPVAGALTLLAVALALAAARQGSLGPVRSALEIGAFLFGCTFVVAHTIVVYRVHKGTDLPRDETDRLAVHLQFGFGYGAWRRAVRRHRH